VKDGWVPQEFALSIASAVCRIVESDYFEPAQLPKPSRQPLTTPQQRLVCSEQLLQVALLNMAAMVQQVYREKKGAAAVPLSAAGNAAVLSTAAAQADQPLQLQQTQKQRQSSRRTQQEIWSVPPHHAELFAAAVGNQLAHMQQHSLALTTSSMQDSTPAKVVSVLHMVKSLLAVRAENKASNSRRHSSSGSLPSALAVPLYGCVAELALLMAGQPEVVAACCSTAAAVCKDAKAASYSAPAAGRPSSYAADAAAAAGSAHDVLAKLHQLMLNELLPAAEHVFK
jgi:hypothetical protein